MDRQAVIIMDVDGQIRLLTPAAEQMLGLPPREVVGRDCSEVLDCRGDDGESLCRSCGRQAAFERRALVQPSLAWLTGAGGRRQPVMLGFWFLPPSGRIQQPRVMAVMRSTASEDAI